MLLVVHKTWLQSNPSLIVQATIYGEEVHTLVETSSAFTTIQPRPVSIRSGLGDPPPPRAQCVTGVLVHSQRDPRNGTLQSVDVDGSGCTAV